MTWERLSDITCGECLDTILSNDGSVLTSLAVTAERNGLTQTEMAAVFARGYHANGHTRP
jgi:hypothetical protein